MSLSAAELFAELRAEGLVSTAEIAATGSDIAAVNAASDCAEIDRHMEQTAVLCAYAGASRDCARWLLEKMDLILPGGPRDVGVMLRFAYDPRT